MGLKIKNNGVISFPPTDPNNIPNPPGGHTAIFADLNGMICQKSATGVVSRLSTARPVGSYLTGVKLSANQSSLSISIPTNTYQALQIIATIENSDTVNPYATLNATVNSNASNYYWSTTWASNYFGSSAAAGDATTSWFLGYTGTDNATSGFRGGEIRMWIYNPNAALTKLFTSDVTCAPTSGGYASHFVSSGEWNNTSVVTSLQFVLGTGQFAAGTIVSIYGIGKI